MNEFLSASGVSENVKGWIETVGNNVHMSTCSVSVSVYLAQATQHDSLARVRSQLLIPESSAVTIRLLFFLEKC